MNLVDSCGWLEYLADGPNADFFEEALCDGPRLIVPTICLVEVRRRILVQRDASAADVAVDLMRQGKVIDLTADIAHKAADLGTTFRLPLADSIILATARSLDAVIWTQDADFASLDNVRYMARP